MPLCTAPKKCLKIARCFTVLNSKLVVFYPLNFLINETLKGRKCRFLQTLNLDTDNLLLNYGFLNIFSFVLYIEK